MTSVILNPQSIPTYQPENHLLYAALALIAEAKNSTISDVNAEYQILPDSQLKKAQWAIELEATGNIDRINNALGEVFEYLQTVPVDYQDAVLLLQKTHSLSSSACQILFNS